MADVAESKSVNRMDERAIAIVIAPNLYHEPTGITDPMKALQCTQVCQPLERCFAQQPSSIGGPATSGSLLPLRVPLHYGLSGWLGSCASCSRTTCECGRVSDAVRGIVKCSGHGLEGAMRRGSSSKSTILESSSQLCHHRLPGGHGSIVQQ